ncbi:hypothetical protein LHK_00812 [Laribacter hongkongensis HLHK9]|uniref:Uncharacterized protein n=1 Tax=Laribacter hongkongensis (strain HLHK9) TaxID=557598 RepID=C1D4L1_LARHH|nr:hypothetical protein LHK_00812 [Laribacter hongkongensis HLHK9]
MDCLTVLFKSIDLYQALGIEAYLYLEWDIKTFINLEEGKCFSIQKKC